MTTLHERLQADVKDAMKAGRKDELEVLRTLLADAKNAAIADGLDRGGIPDPVMLKVIRKGVKSRRESVELYEKGGRDDLVAREQFQIEVLQRYLPADMSDAELEVIVDTVIVELDAKDKSSMGLVMKTVLERVEGRADGKRVSPIVAARLS